METIFEEPVEELNTTECNWFSHLRQRFKRSTYCIQDCIFLSVCVLTSILFSFSIISINLLDVFYYFSNESEAVASAYVYFRFLIFKCSLKYWKTCSLPSLLLVDCLQTVYMGEFHWWIGRFSFMHVLFLCFFLFYPFVHLLSSLYSLYRSFLSFWLF